MRVYVPEDRRDSFVVVSTELPTNPGRSITNADEQIASEILSFH